MADPGTFANLCMVPFIWDVDSFYLEGSGLLFIAIWRRFMYTLYNIYHNYWSLEFLKIYIYYLVHIIEPSPQ